MGPSFIPTFSLTTTYFLISSLSFLHSHSKPQNPNSKLKKFYPFSLLRISSNTWCAITKLKESMKPHIRKLFPLQEDHNPTLFSSENHTHDSATHASGNNNSSSSSSSSSTGCCYNNLKLNPPFDSAMALTVLVLLTALFFMGFFSIYIRRFADESSVDPTRRRRGGENPNPAARTTYRSMSAKGADPTTVKALPVYAYCGGGAKQGIDEMECAICLSEFEEREWIKEIPYCGHVFHVECIDTWLASHVTCPLCRTAKLLAERHVEGGDKEVRVKEGEVEEREVRLVVHGGDTWNDHEVEEREVGPIRGERRSTSCLWCGDRVRLHRSLSF